MLYAMQEWQEVVQLEGSQQRQAGNTPCLHEMHIRRRKQEGLKVQLAARKARSRHRNKPSPINAALRATLRTGRSRHLNGVVYASPGGVLQCRCR